jgi:hypothetical protein
MHLRLISVIVILVASCKTKRNEWQTLDFGVFKLKTPTNWTIVERQGIDSYVGGLTNGKDSLWFDYGWYSGDIDDELIETHLFAKDTVNGLFARVATPSKTGKGVIAMHIPKVKGDDKFTIYGHNVSNSDTVLKIFKSITFENSDTTRNPELTNADFKKLPWGTGKTLYQQNCASCHAIRKELTGPPLFERLKVRDAKWIFKFLTNRKHVLTDTSYQTLNKRYEADCIEFPTLTDEAVETLVDYIKSK